MNELQPEMQFSAVGKAGYLVTVIFQCHRDNRGFESRQWDHQLVWALLTITEISPARNDVQRTNTYVARINS